jgi:fatty acid desaturase
MRELTTITDPVYVERDHFSRFEKFWISKIRDKRDLPFIHVMFKITFLMMLPGLSLFFFPATSWLWWAIAAYYFYVNNIVYKGPFGLMLHCTSHRILFKQKYNFANYYLPWIVSPFFGQTPETYASHHLGMHHVENNLEDDESSTMQYQRDSFRDFMKYFLNFLVKGFVDLVNYFNWRKRYKLRDRVIRGEVLFFVACIALLFVHWPATVVVFILPFFISRFIMMLGNFSQHSFVDFNDPGNNYKNSVNCINTSYNKKCWNDGYHIDHHNKPSLHWTLYPVHFQENIDEFAKHKAFVFDNLDFLWIWIALMRKDYKKLASHLVNINGTFKSEEEAISLMKKRTAKMPKRGITMRSLKNRMEEVKE